MKLDQKKNLYIEFNSYKNEKSIIDFYFDCK